jgi:phosphoribosylanthranilate isomerase
MAGMTLVKVCGLTRAEDVRLAAELGAWALGFVMTESPRRVEPSRVADLLAEVRPAALALAVVTTEPADWIADALDRAGVGAVQLSAGAHGPAVAEVRAAAARLRRRPLVIAAADTQDAHLADFVLLDARTSNAYGGTGETLDWEALAAAPASSRDHLILAGGLRPGNAGEAVRLLRPAAVDVSSGVESAPGRKDHELLREFFAAVEHADREVEAAPATAGRLPTVTP